MMLLGVQSYFQFSILAGCTDEDFVFLTNKNTLLSVFSLNLQPIKLEELKN